MLEPDVQNLNFEYSVFHAWFKAALKLPLLCIYNFGFAVKLHLNLKSRFDLSKHILFEPPTRDLLCYWESVYYCTVYPEGH